MSRFGIADLIDLECRLLADRQADPDELRSRDTAFCASQFPDRPLPERRALLRHWLQVTGDDLPGRRWLATIRHLGALAWSLAFVGGLCLGIGVLAGGGPVDLFLALGLLLGIQLILLLVLLLAPLLGLGPGPVIDGLFATLPRLRPLMHWLDREDIAPQELRMRL
ncbi:MAG: hypothetical protein ACOCXJ_04280, partial [Planctomycetota bacterium]